MSFTLPDGRLDMQALRGRIYDLLGLTFQAASPAPDSLPLLRISGLVATDSGHVLTRAKITGLAFEKRPFTVWELRAVGQGFIGHVVTLPCPIRILGRTVVRPDLYVANPAQIDGMKRLAQVCHVFEGRWEAYSDDQVEGRALLPPDLIERLTLFDLFHPGKAAGVAFQGGLSHLVLPTGGFVTLSGDNDIIHIDVAMHQIIRELRELFEMLQTAERVLLPITRDDPQARDETRMDYYKTALATVEPMVMAAVEAGLIEESSKAKWLTRRHWIVDKRLHGLLRPRF